MNSERPLLFELYNGVWCLLGSYVTIDGLTV